MDALKRKFEVKSKELGAEIKALLSEHGNRFLDEVNISQAYGGMRDITSMIWEPSLLDANDGIRFRGYSIEQLRKKLPRPKNSKEPLPEGLFWLMLTGELPTLQEVKLVSAEWARRADVPKSIFTLLSGLPKDTHPMTQFSMAVMALQSESIFARRYSEGMPKSEYWDATYEDTMNLIAKIPVIAAFIYRKTYFDGKRIKPKKGLDWAANFAHMLGYEDKTFQNLMRLYLTIHADHEGGNASAHTTQLVGSTLSDMYLSFASALNALAGPLHGLANQEVIKWIFEMCEELGTTKPSNTQVEEYVKKTLSSGKVVPGYGHAVLRKPDPRFMAQMNFAKENELDNDYIRIVWQIFEVCPPILQSLGKIKNPWPNVDAHSGALLVNYGFTQYNYFTVLFGVSRALGVLSAQIWARALGFPLERPKSVTTEWIKNYIKEKSQPAD
jgi:citrate synthase